MNLERYKDVIQKIQFQLLTDNTTVYSDEEKVDIVMSILVGVLKKMPEELFVDTEMPASIMGVNLDWTAGSSNDSVVSASLNSEVVDNHNVKTSYARLSVDTEISLATSLAKVINNEGSDAPFSGDYSSYTNVDLKTLAINLLNNINYAQSADAPM